MPGYDQSCRPTFDQLEQPFFALDRELSRIQCTDGTNLAALGLA